MVPLPSTDWYPVADPLADQFGQLYQTVESEGRNDCQDLTASYARGRTIELSIIILGLAGSLFIGWTVLRAVTWSLLGVRNQLHELAAGEGDLTKRLDSFGVKLNPRYASSPPAFWP